MFVLSHFLGNNLKMIKLDALGRFPKETVVGA